MNWRDVRDSVRQQAQVARWQVAGRSFATWTLGEGPLLYLPGQAGGNSETLCLLAWLLRQEFRCVMVDLPAVPRLTQRQCGHSLDQPAADLLEAMRQTDSEPGLVYASGLTGLAAIAAAGQAAERFTGLVLQSVPLGVRLAGTERWLARLGSRVPGLSCAAIPGFRAVLRQNHRRWFPAGAEDRWDYQVAEATSMRMRDFCRRVLLGDRAAAEFDQAEFDQAGGGSGRLPVGGSLPLLLLRTEGDGQVLAAAADRLAEALPGARTGWLGGCGQLPYLTHPHRMARVVREFTEAVGLKPVSSDGPVSRGTPAAVVSQEECDSRIPDTRVSDCGQQAATVGEADSR